MAHTDNVHAVVRRWPVVLAAVAAAVLAALATAGAGAAPPPTRYTATHTLYTGIGAADTAPGGIQLPVLALLATAGEVPAHVAERLGSVADPNALAARVEAVADAQLGTLTVTAGGADAEETERLADTFAAEILDFANDRAEQVRNDALQATNEQIVEYEARVRELDAQLATLPEESAEAGLVRAQRDGTIRQYGLGLERLAQLNNATDLGGRLFTLQAAASVAVSDRDLISPPRSLQSRIILALAVGLAGGVALALVLNRIDDKVRSRRDAEEAFGLPVVAEIPTIGSAILRKGPVSVTQPASYPAEAFRILRMALQLMPRWVLSPTRPATTGDDATSLAEVATTIEGRPKVILVTSPAPGEGKTTTAANLATSFGELVPVVIALDCDLRHPGLLQQFDVAGTTDAVTRSAKKGLRLWEVLIETAVPNVWCYSGANGAMQVLMGSNLESALTQAREIADMVIIDSGPVLTVNDAATLVPLVDAVIVVARSGRTTVESAQRTSELLARIEAPILGVVLTDVSRTLLSQRPSGRYYSSSPVLAKRARPRPRPRARDAQAAPPGMWSIPGPTRERSR